MRVAMFYHSLVSDWNHGNAHFLRGIASELLARGHEVRIFEPRDAWSVRNLVAEHGKAALRRFRKTYPGLQSTRYNAADFDCDAALDGVHLAIVHEWNDPELVRRIGRWRRDRSQARLFFHDTHHRLVTDPQAMRAYDLSHYDGVLAYGKSLCDVYQERCIAARAWTWHEAADTRVFRPLRGEPRAGELVWIGNWGDNERSAELVEFLVQPSQALGLNTRVHGVRYPPGAREILAAAGIQFGGWLPNFEVPRAFSRHRVTVHIPRRPYVQALPGIPTIRVFEALACGIPLVCSPWDDIEGLFEPGRDFLVARTGAEMTAHLRDILNDRELAVELAFHGFETVRARHTCAHRVDELLAIHAALVRPQEVPLMA